MADVCDDAQRGHCSIGFHASIAFIFTIGSNVLIDSGNKNKNNKVPPIGNLAKSVEWALHNLGSMTSHFGRLGRRSPCGRGTQGPTCIAVGLGPRQDLYSFSHASTPEIGWGLQLCRSDVTAGGMSGIMMNRWEVSRRSHKCSKDPIVARVFFYVRNTRPT